MPVLSLDTSAEIAVCVVDDESVVLAADRSAEQRRHAELLAPMVADVLARAGVDRRELTAVVVGTGPAPFTGLRAGLVTARTLAFALGIPVHGVCSLDALAAQAFDAGLAPRGQVTVATDARRREVYAARYRRDGSGSRTGGDVELLWGPAVLRPAALAEEIGDGPAVVVGPGARMYPEHLTAADGGELLLDPAVLARLALLRVAAGRPVPTEPLYLRRPDVTPAAGSKRATG